MRRTGWIAAAALLLVSLAGCGSKSEAAPAKPAAVCYGIANTANSKGLNFGSPLVQDTAYDTVAGFGFVSAVNIDGQPEIVLAQSYDIPESFKQASQQKLKTDARANTTALLAGLQNVIADDAEVDYLEGLRLAARSLSSLEGYDSKTIIMLGTGLSSVGTLDFRNNLLSAEPEALVSLLEERQEIPDLRGFTVVWQQLGDVAAPQKALTQRQRIRLQEIWGAIVERGGGTFVYNDIMAAPAVQTVEYPAVSVVELPSDAPIFFAPEVLETEEHVLEAPILLTEEQVTFIGDKAVYLHPEEAEETIRPVAELLAKHPEVNVLLVGTTAGDSTDAYTLQLSEDRAKTVRDTLIELGVSAERITAIGMGSDDPWHISGVGTEGPLASANRKVVMLDAASEAAREILNGKK